MLAVVIESINQRILDSQKIIGKWFFRFHVSDDISIAELSEIMKFKINVKITDPNQRLTQKEKVVFFNNSVSVTENRDIQELYNIYHEDDGWLYLDFIINHVKQVG